MSTPAVSALTEQANKVITVNFGGRFFRCSQNTYAALLSTQERLTRAHPKAWIRVIQGCYNTGVAASAGTHDYDACLDVQIMGLSWIDGQHFLRQCGWAAWWRHTGSWASPSKWHIHMALLGAPAAGCKVGKYVDGGVTLFGHTVASSQYADYSAHRDGLAGHLSDPTWHPASIGGTIFKYAPWLEDHMQLTAKQIDDIADRVVAKLLGADVDKDTTVKQALARANNVPNIVRNARHALMDAIKPPVKK